jgi:toxin ParE1/3/4
VKRLDYLPQADADLDDIYRWIGQDDPEAARRLIARIVDGLRRLLDDPKSGRSRPEVGDGARSVVIGRYVVFYRVCPHTIGIARVVHGARDVAGLLIASITPENTHEETDWGPPQRKEFWLG